MLRNVETRTALNKRNNIGKAALYPAVYLPTGKVNNPPTVPAKRVVEVAGSIASALTNTPSGPVLVQIDVTVRGSETGT
jgi:hypothetical protein